MVCRHLDLNESEALHTASTSSRTSTALTIKGRWVEQTRARQSERTRSGSTPEQKQALGVAGVSEASPPPPTA